MELEDLKKAWESVESHIGNITQSDNINIKRHAGIKCRLLRRMFLAAMITLIGLAFMATSRIWAPIKLPLPQLITICSIILIGCISELYLVRSIARINLCQDSHTEVFEAVVRIKKTYKKMELWFSVLIALTIGWMTMTPPFVNDGRPVIVWIILSIALVLEYLWYRKTIKTLDELTN